MAREMKDSGIEWIGEIPKTWNVVRTKFITTFINGFAFDSNDFSLDYIYPVVRIGDIKDGSIDYDNCQGVMSNNNLESYQIFENDILLAMSGATVGKVGISTNTKNAYINQRVGIIRTNNPRFLFYCLSAKSFIEYILLMSNGSAQPNVSGTVFGEYKIGFPPLLEQQKIAAHLDSECAKIDNVITKTKATIEEYKKLKQSVITEAVTKGIRPNREMKDSGIEWIGEIPKEWTVEKGKHILTLLERPVKDDDGVITCFRDGEVTLRSNRREEGYTFSIQETGYQGIEPNDLVVHGMDGFAGAIGISDSRGKATPVLNVLDSSEDKKYIMYYLRSMAYNGVFLALSTGIRVRTCDTNWNKLKELPYPVPPKNEQLEISDYIDTKISRINEMIIKKTSLLSELESYKKSIIYEYVTGKKEVI